MSIQETRSEISGIVAATNEYISSISALKGEISNITGSVNAIGESIESNVDSNAILNYSMAEGTKISSSITSCLDLIDNAISNLKSDAAKKIRELVDAYNSYNSSLDKKQQGEYLSYSEFGL